MLAHAHPVCRSATLRFLPTSPRCRDRMETTASLVGFPAPPGLIRYSTAFDSTGCFVCTKPKPGTHASPTPIRRQPSWTPALFSACRIQSPSRRVCQLPPEPARSVSTLSASRSRRTTPNPCRVCFAPATLLSFPPSGLCSSPGSVPVSGSLLPCCFSATTEMVPAAASKGCSPGKSVELEPCFHESRTNPALLTFFPSEAFSATAADPGFPESSSYMLSRTDSPQRTGPVAPWSLDERSKRVSL